MVMKKKPTKAKKTERKSTSRKHIKDEQLYRESLSKRENPSVYKKIDEKKFMDKINAEYDYINSNKIFNKIKHIHDKRSDLRDNIDEYFENIESVLHEIVFDNHYFTNKDKNTLKMQSMLKDIMDDIRRAGRNNFKYQRYFEHLRDYFNKYPNLENIKTGASLEDRPSRRELIKKFGASGRVESKASGSIDSRIVGEDIPAFEPFVGETIPKEVYRKSNSIAFNIKRDKTNGKSLKLKIKKIDPKKMFSGYKLAGKR